MSPKAPRPSRVLVVDDEPDFATVLTAWLRRRGFLADAAFSGHDALARLDRSTHDVVILDLKIPGMDGLAVLREVRHRDEAVHVVVLTGYGTVSSCVGSWWSWSWSGWGSCSGSSRTGCSGSRASTSASWTTASRRGKRRKRVIRWTRSTSTYPSRAWSSTSCSSS